MVCLKLEKAGSAKYKQSKSVCVFFSFKVSLFIQFIHLSVHLVYLSIQIKDNLSFLIEISAKKTA